MAASGDPRVDTLVDDERLGPWLFTVARNLYFSWRRSRAVDEARTSELDPAWPAPERGDSPFEAAARQRARAAGGGGPGAPALA